MSERWGLWCDGDFWADAREGEVEGLDPFGDYSAVFLTRELADAGIERRRRESPMHHYEARPMGLPPVELLPPAAESVAIVAPPIDRGMLTRAHAVLCRLETELKTAGRGEEADVIGYVDLIVLALRNRA